MSKFYLIALNVLPIFISSTEILNNFLNSLSSISQKINNDIRNIKIKYGLAKKNLILGGIRGMPWKSIKPFFVSLFDANITNCDIVMFCKKISNEVRDNLISLGVKILDIPDEFNKLSVPDVRYVIYERYLRDKWQNYNMILTVDIRDAFFQKDIFRQYENYKSFLGLAIEDGTLDEKSNKRWLLRIYGNETYEAIKNERIICCGSVWGTSDKFYQLTYDMSKELNAKYPLKIFVHDQPVLNYFVYYLKKYQDFIVKSDNNGSVMTIGTANRKNLLFDSNKNILNYKGEIAALVHQYDRFPDILHRIKKKFDHDIKINNDNYESNSIYIYCIILLICIFLVVILLILFCKYFLKKFLNMRKDKFKKVKIEKSKNKKKKKTTKGKWSLVLNNSENI